MCFCRLGAFGFATDTEGLMKEMEGATNYLKAQKGPVFKLT